MMNREPRRQALRLLMVSAALVLSLVAGGEARAAEKPAVIRMAVPGVGVGNRPYIGGSTIATVALKGMLEEEFKNDGIKIEWTYLPGAGPAVNELFANGLADFGAGLGDLPSIIGKSGGLKTKILAAAGIRQHTFLAVPADSSVKTIEDLKGKTIALFKGTNIQLAVAKILAAHGIGERDARIVVMDNETAKAAIITHSVDAAWGGSDYLQLRDQGTARIVYVARGDDNPTFLRHSSLVASEPFIAKYPEVTERVVKVLVQSAKWQSDLEASPSPAYSLWTKAGTPYNAYKEDLTGTSLKQIASPLFDDYLRAQYKAAIVDAQKFKLIRANVDLDQWLDLRFLDQALKELNLEHYWPQYDASGKARPQS